MLAQGRSSAYQTEKTIDYAILPLNIREKIYNLEKFKKTLSRSAYLNVRHKQSVRDNKVRENRNIYLYMPRICPDRQKNQTGSHLKRLSGWC